MLYQQHKNGTGMLINPEFIQFHSSKIKTSVNRCAVICCPKIGWAQPFGKTRTKTLFLFQCTDPNDSSQSSRKRGIHETKMRRIEKEYD